MQTKKLSDDESLAHTIISDANKDALNLCQQKGLDGTAAYQALMQVCFRSYANILCSDLEAIRHIREFLNDWEVEVTEYRH